MVYLDIPFKKTHSLTYLFDLINDKEKISNEFYEIAAELDSYAIEIRYPDDWYEPSIDEAKDAYYKAEKIIDSFKKKLSR